MGVIDNMNFKPDVEAIFEFVGKREKTFFEGYRPAHLIGEGCLTTGIHNYYDCQDVMISSEIRGTITFITPESYPACLWVGKKIDMYEGGTMVGYATITKIFNPILEK